MHEPWQHQLRVYLSEHEAQHVRLGQSSAALSDVLSMHAATMISQIDAFDEYVVEAEKEGVENYPLYRWTKATVADPAMRAKHGIAFAIRVHGAELYQKDVADRLETDLRPLIETGILDRMSRHDTNPATSIPIPEEYRSAS